MCSCLVCEAENAYRIIGYYRVYEWRERPGWCFVLVQGDPSLLFRLTRRVWLSVLIWSASPIPQQRTSFNIHICLFFVFLFLWENKSCELCCAWNIHSYFLGGGGKIECHLLRSEWRFKWGENLISTLLPNYCSIRLIHRNLPKCHCDFLYRRPLMFLQLVFISTQKMALA